MLLTRLRDKLVHVMPPARHHLDDLATLNGVGAPQYRIVSSHRYEDVLWRSWVPQDWCTPETMTRHPRLARLLYVPTSNHVVSVAEHRTGE